MKKKVLLLCALTSIVLSACGSSSAVSNKSSSTQTPESTPVSTPTLTPTPTPSPTAAAVQMTAAATYSNSFTNTKGYNLNASLTFYTPIRSTGKEFAHPEDDSVTIPALKDQKATKNSWIVPFVSEGQNTTKDFSVQADMEIMVGYHTISDRHDKAFQNVEFNATPYKDFATDFYYYSDYKKIWSKATTPDMSFYPRYSCNMEWSSIASGHRFRILGYLVLYDVYTPLCPDGLPYYFWPDYDIHVDTKLGGADGSQDSILFDAAILKQDDGTSTGRFVFYDLAKQKEEATALMSSNDDAAKASSFVKK